jgi:hypothetical protein
MSEEAKKPCGPSVKLQADICAEVQEFAAADDRTFTSAVNRLLREALKARADKAAQGNQSTGN